MKLSLNIVLILHLLLISVFSAQAEDHDAYTMQQMQSCLCENSAEMSANQCCSTASVVPFDVEQSTQLGEILIYALSSFNDYKYALLSEHATRVFRPPMIHILI